MTVVTKRQRRRRRRRLTRHEVDARFRCLGLDSPPSGCRWRG
jgi:hypothetical protein